MLLHHHALVVIHSMTIVRKLKEHLPQKLNTQL